MVDDAFFLDKNEELFEWHQPRSKSYNDKILKQAFDDAEKIVYGENKGKHSNFRGSHTEVKVDNPETRLTKFGVPDDEKTYRKLVRLKDDNQKEAKRLSLEVCHRLEWMMTRSF